MISFNFCIFSFFFTLENLLSHQQGDIEYYFVNLWYD